MRPGEAVKDHRRNSYAARHDINGTVVRPADVGTGHDTIRPVKRFDSIGSNRQSSELVAQRKRSGDGLAAFGHEGEKRPTTDESGVMGRLLVDEVLVPTLDKASQAGNLDGREVEALSMISNGLADLADANPELAYKTVTDLLVAINECVQCSQDDKLTRAGTARSASISRRRTACSRTASCGDRRS